jgi:hypothetical protein
MSLTAGASWCAAGLAICVLAGCGGSATPAERQARCYRAHQNDTDQFNFDVPHSAWQAVVRRVCGEAQREGKLNAQGALGESGADAILRRRPRVVYPLCEAEMIRARDQALRGAVKYLPTRSMRKLGRHYCDVVVSSGLWSDEDGFSAADREKVSRQHPEILAPFCLAGAYADYEREKVHVFTHPDLRKVMTRVCVKAITLGYIRASGHDDLAAIKALSKRVTVAMIKRGELHPTTTT